MAKCKFRLELPHGVVWAGKRLDGVIEIEAPKAIPRADGLDLQYTVSAWAGYGSGKSRSVTRAVIFAAPLHVDMPEDGLPAGTHRYPFAIDVPPWMPPPYIGDDCAIEHSIKTRL